MFNITMLFITPTFQKKKKKKMYKINIINDKYTRVTASLAYEYDICILFRI